MTENEMYGLDREDREFIDGAAEWFLGSRKPRTASEVRGVLVKLYLNGAAKGIRLTKDVLEDVTRELEKS